MDICLQRAYGGKNCSPHLAANQKCNGLDGGCASFLLCVRSSLDAVEGMVGEALSGRREKGLCDRVAEE